MEQRISLVTLGVTDVDKTAGFYETMGWSRVDTPDNIVVYDLLGQSIGLYPLAGLAEDIGLPVESLGKGGMTLGQNLRSKEEVDALMAKVGGTGGKVLKQPQEVFWGGYHGYFADPEGHIWEIAFNPFSPLRAEDGAFCWGGY
ncbi:VOC family protein [Tropicibacter sp. R15_0]|uniref:VOC family protein n=1 Tax=Tropicibacter sp. R15_0 TaxID=2821101 RepID=UPI001ADC848F|nr:VOC family protein [Tropicibacter sp. R15_0]MBO9468340.1 VOC family protein [Tropicibacter sp. R15_0]